MLRTRSPRRGRTARATNRLRVGTLVVFGTLILAGTSDRLDALAGSQRRPLHDLLEDLRQAGMPIVYSSRLVRPEMTVPPGAPAKPSRERLESLLAVHDLGLEDGPNGVLLVVRRTMPRTAVSVSAQRFSDVGASSPAATTTVAEEPGLQVPTWTLRETIDVVHDDAPAAPPPGVTFDRREIDALPDQRNPWALMSRIAGVTTDRVDVGGSETGSQASMTAPATAVAGNTFHVDGIETTDMASTGHSTIFFDLEHFETLQLGSGGVDVTTATAGVALRLTTKRGGEDPRGSVHASHTEGSGEDRRSVSGLGSNLGNRIERVLDAGLEVGGPLIRDRFYAWAGLSVDDVEMLATGGARDDTRLAHGALKLNIQPNRRASLVASAVSSDKRKPARGVGPTRAPASAWRQKTPSTAFKLEHSQMLRSNAVITGHASHVDGEFSLRAQGGDGPDGAEAFLDPDGIWQGSFLSGFSDRDTQRYEASVDLFLSSGVTDHKLRFGASYRRFDTASSFVWPGARQASRIACELIGSCPDGENDSGPLTGELIVFNRDGTSVTGLDYQALWLQDTLRRPRTTIDVGLRFDRQRGAISPGSVDANISVPEVLPAIQSNGVDGGFSWSSLSPRLGIARAFGADHRTVLRLSFSRFAGQLGTQQVSRLDPLQGASASFLYQDLDGDRDWQEGEPLDFLGVFGQNQIDPTSGTSPNRNDPNLRPEITDEVVAGFDHEIGGRISLGTRVTWRRVYDIHDARLLVLDPAGDLRVAQPGDYSLERVLDIFRPDGTPNQTEFYSLRPEFAFSGGSWLTNGDRERHYLGLGLSFIRRQDRRYRVRAHLDWGTAEWRVPDAFAAFADPNDRLGSETDDGDLFAERSPTVASGNTFLQSGWSASLSGNLHIAPQRPWGFSLAGSAFAREGQPLPYYVSLLTSDSLRRDIQVTRSLDEFRSGDLMMVDLRLSKDLRLSSRLDTTISLEVFNALDRRTALDRTLDVFSSLAGSPSRTVAPRVLRLGMRLSWK